MRRLVTFVPIDPNGATELRAPLRETHESPEYELETKELTTIPVKSGGIIMGYVCTWAQATTEARPSVGELVNQLANVVEKASVQ